ncbi:MAG: hypothetical protein V3R94_06325 [Acidobacteriota bacterium]
MNSKTPQRAVIFIPGFYGSALKNSQTSERIWLTASEALWGSSTLALDEGGLAIPKTIDLVPDGILRKVRAIPFLWEEDIYDSILKKLEGRLGESARIIPFAYDWRRNNLKAVAQLGQLIDELLREGTPSISIVAHSMGGLITAYYLRYGTTDPATKSPRETWEGLEKIDRVVLAGVPFRGSMLRLREMQSGARFGLNKTLVTREAASSFPSSYQLLPLIGDSLILSQNLAPIPHALSDPENWAQHGWGLFGVPELSPTALEHRRHFTERVLGQGKRFLQWINHPSEGTEKLPSRLLHIYGKGTLTLARAVVVKDDETNRPMLIFDESDMRKHYPETPPGLLLEDGDGSVTVESAALPEVLEAKFHSVSSFETSNLHADIFKDPEVKNKVFAFLEEDPD